MSQESGLFIASLGSRRMSRRNVEQVAEEASALGCFRLTTCLLDDAELINLRELYGLTGAQSRLCVEERSIRARSWLDSLKSPKVTVTSLSELKAKPAFSSILEAVRAHFCNDQHFQNAVTNQTFKNLDPILRRRGVTNRRYSIVSKLAEYLLLELSAEIFLLAEHGINVVYSLEAEMEITRRLFSGDLGLQDRVTMPTKPQHFEVFWKVEDASVSVDKVGYRYTQNEEQDDFELKDVSFEARPGAVVGVFGPSGSGKTTLLRLIGGHLKPSSGTIRIGSQQTGRSKDKDLGVLTVFQDGALFPHMTVEENIDYSLRRHRELTSGQRSTLISNYLRRFGVENRRRYLPGTLSGGERQRVALARALAAQPRVLLLDEPTASLDHIRKDEIRKLLVQVLSVPPVPTVVAVSHDREFLFSICSDLAIVVGGRLLMFGPLKTVLREANNLTTVRILGFDGWINGEVTSDGLFLFRNMKENCQFMLNTSHGESCTGPATLIVPPEAIVGAEAPQAVKIRGVLASTSVSGSGTQVELSLGVDSTNGGRLYYRLAGIRALSEVQLGGKEEIHVDPALCRIVPR